MRVAIVGSRNFGKLHLVREYVMDRLKAGEDVVVSGGARGVDSIAEQAAVDAGIEVRVFPAQWQLYGRSAGYRRNVDIVNDADRVVAFWDGSSRGTKHTIDIAHEKGKPTEVFFA